MGETRAIEENRRHWGFTSVVGGVYGGRKCWKMAMLLGRKVVDLDRMVAENIENVIMEEVLRWWKQRKELIF